MEQLAEHKWNNIETKKQNWNNIGTTLEIVVRRERQIASACLRGKKNVTKVEQHWNNTGRPLEQHWNNIGTNLEQHRNKIGTTLGQH